jgi:hypothetical protein
MVEVRNCDYGGWEIAGLGILKDGRRTKELSMGLANLMECTSMYSE